MMANPNPKDVCRPHAKIAWLVDVVMRNYALLITQKVMQYFCVPTKVIKVLTIRISTDSYRTNSESHITRNKT